MPRLLPIALLTATVLAFSATMASADYSNSTWVNTGTPFGGWWDRFGLAHPSFHHRVECEPPSSKVYSTKPSCNYNWGPGDWSIDYYGNNRPIIFIFPNVSGNVTAKVWAIYPTCAGSGGASIAGSTVFVDIYINGSWEGWESFGHLNNVQVSPGQTLWQSAVLGYTKNWGYKPGCHEVTTSSGVHTHHEEWNTYKYACYKNRTSGQYLDYNKHFGTIGKTVYSAPRKKC